VDGVGRRIGRKVAGVLEKKWLYQDGVNPVAELDGTGAVVSRFVYGTRAFVPDYMVKAGATYRIVSDELGSVRRVVDVSTGVIVHELVYDRWGRVLLDTNPGWQPFGYAGGLYEPVTGLVRFGARDYDAEVGRWTTKDPIRFGGGTNLYAYADNDPINLIDPLGQDPWAGFLFSGIAHGGFFAVAQSFGKVRNLRTGEICSISVTCFRGGPGIGVIGGLEVFAIQGGPSCGKDLGGFTFGAGADVAIGPFPFSVALGGSGGGDLGLPVGVPGVGGGVGASMGIDVCLTRVIECSNAP